MENMFEVLNTQPKIQDRPDATPLAVRTGTLEFTNVVFGYSNSHPVLKGVSFTVTGRQTVALVGATGSGKSTVLRLVLRFYDPQSGCVCIDGQDISHVTQV